MKACHSFPIFCFLAFFALLPVQVKKVQVFTNQKRKAA